MINPDLTNALRQALRARDQAEENCPHWDYETGSDKGEACCYACLEAGEAVRQAKVAVQKAKAEAAFAAHEQLGWNMTNALKGEK